MNIALKIVIPAIFSLVGWYIAGMIYDKWEDRKNDRE